MFLGCGGGPRWIHTLDRNQHNLVSNTGAAWIPGAGSLGTCLSSNRRRDHASAAGRATHEQWVPRDCHTLGRLLTRITD